MPSEIRMKRIQDQIQRVLTEILETKVNDPRLSNVYVTDVSVDRELDYANIYVHALGGQGLAEEILDSLERASGFIRYTLGQEVQLRMMPKLRFYWDETPDRADRIESILQDIREEREARGVEGDDVPSESEEDMHGEGN